IPERVVNTPAPDVISLMVKAEELVKVALVESMGAVTERAVARSIVVAMVAPVNTAVSITEVTCVGPVKVIVPGVKVRKVFSAVAPSAKVAAEPVRVKAPALEREKSV